MYKGVNDLSYAFEFVAEGLIWKNRTAIKHHFIVHGCDFDSLFIFLYDGSFEVRCIAG